MAMRYGYFDSEITGVDSEGMPIFDRAETSELFRLLFAKLLTNGVLALPGDCFQVVAGSSGLTVKIRPGFGLINGAFAYDGAEETYALATAPTQYSRIDRVVLRCNYLVSIGTNQGVITQSSITDTRADSSVCGFITQLIDHLDTEVFYDQFNAFYTEFVEKSDASYEMFQNMATQAYNGYTAAIDEYIEQLEAKGNADLTATTEALKEFQRNSQNAFNAWFAEVQGLLDEDVAGRLINITNEQGERLSLLEYMNIHNDFFAPLLDDDGNVILDDDDNAVMVDWKYMYA